MNLKETIKYQEKMLEVRREHLETEKEIVARELRYLADKVENGRIYSTDSRNTIGLLEDLHNLLQETREEEHKLDLLKSIED